MSAKRTKKESDAKYWLITFCVALICLTIQTCATKSDLSRLEIAKHVNYDCLIKKDRVKLWRQAEELTQAK